MMKQYKRIFIIGHPGAGKALLAKTTAESLGWELINADSGLEFHVGRTLTEIVSKEGERAFQNCASEILTALLAKENIVVTTDASIVCDEKNLQLLSSEFVVYLKVTIPVQLERISRNPEPLLPVTDLKTFLNKLHQERDGLYDEVADLSIDSDDNELEKHVITITKNILKNSEKQTVEKLLLNKKDLTIFHKKSHKPVHLSGQQGTCLKLLIQGKTSKEIARDMNISYRTVEGYIAKAMEELGCSSSKQLIA